MRLMIVIMAIVALIIMLFAPYLADFVVQHLG